MKTILTTLSLISLCTSLAQPVITNGANLQAIGSSNPSVFVSIADIGIGGANQTWDFSSAPTTNVANLSVVDVSSTPYSSSFPTSNWTFEIGPYYSYFEVGSSEMNNLAFNITSVNGNGDYSSNPRKVLQFPFNYTDVFTDVFSENGNTENLTVTYEGYGTLLMPGGFNYSNVIRVREDETSSGYFTIRYYLTEPLTIIATYLSQTDVFLWTKVEQTNGLSEVDSKLFTIYPNPAQEVLNIRATSEAENSLTISGSDGRIVKTIMISAKEQSIDISELPAGWYIVSDGTSQFSFNKIN